METRRQPGVYGCLCEGLCVCIFRISEVDAAMVQCSADIKLFFRAQCFFPPL